MPKLTKQLANEPLPKGIDTARLLDVQDLRRWWRCSRKYIWQITKRAKGDKKLPSYRLGKKRLFIYDECYWYLKKQED